MPGEWYRFARATFEWINQASLHHTLSRTDTVFAQYLLFCPLTTLNFHCRSIVQTTGSLDLITNDGFAKVRLTRLELTIFTIGALDFLVEGGYSTMTRISNFNVFLI